MVNEKDELNDTKKELCTSVFKKNILTKEDYTNRWIETITAMENKKSVNFSSNR